MHSLSPQVCFELLSSAASHPKRRYEIELLKKVPCTALFHHNQEKGSSESHDSALTLLLSKAQTSHNRLHFLIASDETEGFFLNQMGKFS